jgi:hypothetical protein
MSEISVEQMPLWIVPEKEGLFKYKHRAVSQGARLLRSAAY